MGMGKIGLWEALEFRMGPEIILESEGVTGELSVSSQSQRFGVGSCCRFCGVQNQHSSMPKAQWFSHLSGSDGSLQKSRGLRLQL